MVKKGRREGTLRFTLAPNGEARKAFVAGDFTGWESVAMRKRSGIFGVTIALPPGCYQYKSIVDGHWMKDPDNSDWDVSDMGTVNSIVAVD